MWNLEINRLIQRRNDVDRRSGKQLKELRLILLLTFILLVLASYQVSMEANSIGVLFVSRL